MQREGVVDDLYIISLLPQIVNIKNNLEAKNSYPAARTFGQQLEYPTCFSQ